LTTEEFSLSNWTDFSFFPICMVLPKMKRKQLFLLVVFVVAIVVRLLCITLVKGLNAPLWGDSAAYDRIGINICCGGGLTVWRAPLFPLYLSLVYSLLGHSYIAARVSLAVLSSLNCVLIFFVTKEAFNKRAAYISTLIFLLYPPLIYWNAYLHSETLLAFLLTLCILYLVRTFRSFSLPNLMLTGLFVGLSMLTHPSAIFLAVLIPLWAFLTFKPNYKRVILAIFWTIGSVAVTLSPWTLRNYLATGSFVPLTTLSGPALAMTHNPVILERIEHGSFKERWETPNCVSPELSGLLTTAESTYVDRAWSFRYPAMGRNTRAGERSAVEFDRFLRRKALQYIKDNPLANAKIALHQIPVFFHLYFPRSHEEKLRRLALCSYFVVLILGIAGLVCCFNRRKALWIFYMLWLYGILIPLVFYARRRFRIPIELSIVVLSGVTIDSIACKITAWYARFKGLYPDSRRKSS
jgi:4-amino-4-deoxy-L-arabinose transferase-like glycosyltransferase